MYRLLLDLQKLKTFMQQSAVWGCLAKGSLKAYLGEQKLKLFFAITYKLISSQSASSGKHFGFMR